LHPHRHGRRLAAGQGDQKKPRGEFSPYRRTHTTNRAEEFHPKFTALKAIPDPVEREAAQRQLFDEFTDAVTADARAESEALDAALGYYLDRFKGSLYMVLDNGETFSPLHGCQIVNFPDKWSEKRINDFLAAEDEGCSENVVYWFDF
jgi:hypothetical protein